MQHVVWHVTGHIVLYETYTARHLLRTNLIVSNTSMTLFCFFGFDCEIMNWKLIQYQFDTRQKHKQLKPIAILEEIADISSTPNGLNAFRKLTSMTVHVLPPFSTWRWWTYIYIFAFTSHRFVHFTAIYVSVAFSRVRSAVRCIVFVFLCFITSSTDRQKKLNFVWIFERRKIAKFLDNFSFVFRFDDDILW